MSNLRFAVNEELKTISSGVFANNTDFNVVFHKLNKNFYSQVN